MNKKETMYVDMDDTICNFTKAYSKMKSPECFYPQSTYGFFRNLEPMEDAIESYKILEKYFDLWILTKPSIHNPLCYSEKREWVETHLGFETCNKLILSPDKSLLKGHYLIDDNIHEGFEGKLLHFGVGKDFPNWNYVLEHFKIKK